MEEEGWVVLIISVLQAWRTRIFLENKHNEVQLLFMAAAENIDPKMLEQCDMPEWREQFRVYYDKLHKIALLPGSESFLSLELMVRQMNTEGKLYKGCDAVMVLGLFVSEAMCFNVYKTLLHTYKLCHPNCAPWNWTTLKNRSMCCNRNETSPTYSDFIIT